MTPSTTQSISSYFKKSFSTGMLNVGGSAVITGIFLPLLVQQIGIETYGQWSLLYFFTGFSNLLDFGLSKSLVFLLPKQQKQKEINKIYSAGLIINNFSIFILLLLCAIIYGMDINIWQTKEAFPNETGSKLFLFGSLLAAISLMTQFYRSILEAFYKIHFVNIGFLILTALTYIPLFFLSFFTQKIEAFIYCTVTTSLVILLFHIIIVKLTCTPSLILPSKATFKKIFSCSLKFLSIGLLIAVALPINRYLLISLSDDSSVYGTFDISFKIAMMANSCLALFATPMLSLFSGFGKERLQDIKLILKRSLIWLGSAYLLGNVIFFYMGEQIVAWLFKIDSPEIYTSSMILIAGICLTGVAEPFYRAFLGLGELRFPTLIKIILCVLNIIFIVILYNASPLYRISLAISMAYGITAILTIVKFKQISTKR